MLSTTCRLVAGCHPRTPHVFALSPPPFANTLPRLLLRYQSSAAAATASRQQPKYDASYYGKKRSKPTRQASRASGDPHRVSLEQNDLFQIGSTPKGTRSRQPAQKSNRGPKGNQGQKGKRDQAQKANRAPATKEDHRLDSVPLPSETPVPTDDELPEWIQSRERRSTKSTVCDVVRNAFNNYTKDGSLVYEIASSKRDKRLYTCTVTAKAGELEWKAVAEARTKISAKDIACLLVVVEINTQGLDGDLFPVPRKLAKFMDQHTKKDTLQDVYNYAASLGTVPSVSFGPAKLLDGHYQYIISLPEQNIRVSAVSTSHTRAEVAACMKFKKAAAKHVANSDIENLTAQSSDRLNSGNAAKFLNWLYNRHRRPFSLTSNFKSKQQLLYGREQICDASVTYQAAGEKRTTPIISSWYKEFAEDAATIHAAVSAAKDEPALLQQFIEELIGGKGHLLEVSRPIDLEITPATDYAMRNTLSIPGLPQLAQELQDSGGPQKPQHIRNRTHALTEDQKSIMSSRLKSLYDDYLHSDSTAAMRKLKSELPMNQYRPAVSEIVENNVYSIIIGATGSGKTTQVPQIVLEKYYQEGRGADCNIICTQPRRIAATSVAGRVADELGPGLKDHVGYQVRFDSRPPTQGGSVTYCTTGILLQQLQYEPDRVFDEVSHLMIDEVHERDTIIDFTLTVLKRAVTDRLARGLKVPRITLMSATLDTELFAEYFKNLGSDGQHTPAPVLSVPGRTFPVSEKHLENVLSEIRGRWSSTELGLLQTDRDTATYIATESKFAGIQSSLAPSQKQNTDINSAIDWKQKPVYDEAVASAKEDTISPSGLIATTIAHVLRTTMEGAVLVFLPGLPEIQAIEKILRTQSVLGVNVGDESKYKFFLLHSSIPDSQKTVFEKTPQGIRKVILSTNIAETSVTIPDVQHVIDTGKVRQIQYDNTTRVSWLQNCWISKSNAKQRAGRAGRVQNGHYLALYSQARREAMPAIGIPELLRSDLQSTCLSVRATIRGVGVTDFLADAIDPPNPTSVEEALARLVNLGALNAENGELTSLGHLLSSLPVHPALGKMIVLGIMFKCLDPILIIGAAAEERGLFVMAPDIKAASLQTKSEFSGETCSDHLAVYNAFCHVREQYSPENDSYARRAAFDVHVHFGAWKAIQRASQQMQEILQEAGVLTREITFKRDHMIGGPAWNVNSHKPHIVKAILLAGLQPNIGHRRKASYRMLTLGDRPAAEPANFSVLRNNRNAWEDDSLVAFTSVAKSTDGRSFSLRELSIVRPLAVALFGGTLDAQDRSNLLTVNRWLKLYVKSDPSQRRYTSNNQSQLVHMRQNLDRVLKVAFENLVNGRRRGVMATPNDAVEPVRWVRGARLTQGQKAIIVSEFLAGVVKTLDGAETSSLGQRAELGAGSSRGWDSRGGDSRDRDSRGRDSWSRDPRGRDSGGRDSWGSGSGGRDSRGRDENFSSPSDAKRFWLGKSETYGRDARSSEPRRSSRPSY